MDGDGVEEIRRLTREDAEHYEGFLRERAAAGTRVVFRTAINAQTLYLVRQRLHAVKVDTLDAGAPGCCWSGTRRRASTRATTSTCPAGSGG
ncbi:hypothetical protein NKH77_02035 [Streptomyces sp. M19]